MKLLSLCLLLCACGGKSEPTVQPPKPVVAVAAVDAGTDPGATDTPTEGKLSQEECDALFNHIFDVAVIAQQESLPPEERPTEADIATAKTKMRGELIPECIGRTPAELKYSCFMAASDRAGFEACDNS